VQILERFELHLLCMRKVSSYSDVIDTEGADAIDYQSKDRCRTCRSMTRHIKMLVRSRLVYHDPWRLIRSEGRANGSCNACIMLGTLRLFAVCMPSETDDRFYVIQYEFLDSGLRDSPLDVILCRFHTLTILITKFPKIPLSFIL
jgi:hypothetical protein